MIKYKMFNHSLATVIGVTAIFISSCASDPKPNPVNPALLAVKANEEARKYNLALGDAIQSADKIIIKEHSNKVDFFEVIPELVDIPKYIYAQKELSTGEKILFLDSVRKLKDEANMTVAADCLFVPHQTIDFYEQGELKSSMQVCYKCSEIKWNGSAFAASKDIFDAITPAINRAGLQTHRDWDAMAKIRYEAEKQNQPIGPRPDPQPGGVPTAKWAPGERGKKVINPYTRNLVDVEGIPAKTKVRDPNDNDPTHIFRVPEM